MKVLMALILSLICIANAQTKIDVKELRCLVCKATLAELDTAIKKIDPDRTVDIGGYRIDAKGNFKQKKISEAKSEVHLSELADTICDKMDDYIRATWKDSGKLTILPLLSPSGGMNPDMGLIDVIQDDDLNKSLKYYCQGIIEEFEEDIIKHYKNNSDNVDIRVCSNDAKLCKDSLPESDERMTDEL